MNQFLSVVRTTLFPVFLLLVFSNGMAQTNQRIVVKTNAVTTITATTATVHYLVKAEEVTVLAHGVYYSKNPLPTIADSIAGPNNKKNIYVGDMADLLGLTPATRYYVRAWASTQAGIIYGAPLSFKTKKQKKKQ